jgi:hypothetical protein
MAWAIVGDVMNGDVSDGVSVDVSDGVGSAVGKPANGVISSDLTSSYCCILHSIRVERFRHGNHCVDLIRPPKLQPTAFKLKHTTTLHF